jgi:uncharacterized repeat protein (TIGR03803 family)
MSCARFSQSSLPSVPEGDASKVRPATAWLCGEPPSEQARGETGAPLVENGYKSLYKFKAGSDGGYPFGELVAVSGKLYGTTDEGGAAGYGTVFEMTTSGQEHVIYSFKGGTKDGAYPCAGVIDVGGQLYGTTQAGGSAGWGTIYHVSTSGDDEHVIYSFKAGKDGAAPYAGLLELNGKLYGTTVEGGTAGWGTAFESPTSGPAHVIYSFKAGSKDGGYPYSKLIAIGDTLYGTTQEGGSAGWGTAFRMSTTGQEHVIYSFKAGSDGGYPFAGLTDLDGKLYGTTKEGGAAGYGTIFDMTPGGDEHVLYSFKSNADGAYPYAGLLTYNGLLFGTTYQGGKPNWGTVFKSDTSGKESVLYAFKAGKDGAYPFARLIELGGKLYGTTQGGGVNGGWGTAFTIAP